VLVTDAGDEVLIAGGCAGFKAGAADGHHIQKPVQSRCTPPGDRLPTPRRGSLPSIPESTYGRSAATGDTHRDANGRISAVNRNAHQAAQCGPPHSARAARK